LNRFAPLDNRNDVGVVVGVQQTETGAVVEASVEIDGLDAEVKAVKQFEEFTEDITGGFASGQLANRQCIAFVSNSDVERRIGVK
jgi:hypothetical protein